MLTIEPPVDVPAWQLWLISRHRDGLSEVLSIAGGQTLPVFSFEEEAEMFLRFGAFGPGWRVRRTAPWELISLLNGPHAGVAKVALDPPPEVCGWALVDLVSLTKKEFLRTLSGESRPRNLGRARTLARPDTTAAG